MRRVRIALLHVVVLLVLIVVVAAFQVAAGIWFLSRGQAATGTWILCWGLATPAFVWIGYRLGRRLDRR